MEHLSGLDADADAPVYRSALSGQQAVTLAAALRRRLLETPKLSSAVMCRVSSPTLSQVKIASLTP